MNQVQQKNQREEITVLDQNSGRFQFSPIAQNDQNINQKMEIYSKSNPLNAIPENWELESKTSGMQESQSYKKLSNSKSNCEQRFIQETITEDGKFIIQSLPLNLSTPQHSPNNINISPIRKDSNKVPNSARGGARTESKTMDRKDKVEAIKARLKQLFLNYCDYSMENGNIYITYTNLIKVIRDAEIYDDLVNQNVISILISKECKATANMIKHITFEQFLNTILRISEAKFPEKFKKYPKSALKSLLKYHILPLLKRIEEAVEKHSDVFQYSLYTISELTLKLIVYNDDTQVIFCDILPIIKLVYQKYFEQESSANKLKSDENLKLSLRSVMQFVRDFELCPYLLHQKACFLIWYSIAHSKDLSELTNNQQIKSILPQFQNTGKSFTLGHFVIFLYRLGVIYFNHSQEAPQEFNLIKKLLFFLRKLENSEGFKKFLNKLNRTYNDSLTFLPSKDLLIQILKAEGLEDMGLNPEDYFAISKDVMISRIIDTHLFENLKTQQNNLNDSQDNDNEIEQYLMNIEDDLKKIFEIYCSFGEPMNTKYLKSSKLIKLFKDCGIIKSLSRLPPGIKDAQQLTTVEVDLAFKVITSKTEMNKNFDQFQSCMTVNSNHNQSQQISGFLKYQSQIMQSKFKKTQSNYSTLQQSSSFDHRSHLLDRAGQKNSRIEYEQFKELLENLSSKVYPQHSTINQQAYSEFLRNLVLPQLKHVNDKRCIHNNKISKMLMLLDNQEMINLLTILHKSIIDVYKVYADSKLYMNFQQFINLCTDFDIFPGVISKPTLHRIFHSLSFMNDALGTQSKMQKSMAATQSRIQSPTRQQQNELIDEHLFVESLALIALYSEVDGYKSDDDQNNENDLDEQKPFAEPLMDGADNEDTNEASPIEKVLSLIEKMANSEGVHRKLKKASELSNTIKCNLMDKKDILELFRIKYPWYFRYRYQEYSQKKKNFQDIMEMSSILTDQSQIDL